MVNMNLSKKQGTQVEILRLIRRLYIALHKGTDAAPSLEAWTSTDRLDYAPVIADADSIASVLLTQPAHPSDASTSRAVSQHVKDIARPSSPPDPTTRSEIGDSSQSPTVTSHALSVHTGPRPTDASPPSTVATAADCLFSRPLEGTTQHNIVAPCPEPYISNICPSCHLHLHPHWRPVLAPVLNTSLTYCDAGAASASDPLLLASSVVSHEDVFGAMTVGGWTTDVPSPNDGDDRTGPARKQSERHMLPST